MQPSEKWFDLVYEDYCTYLETVDEDTYPMSYESFEWLKLREFQQDQVI